MRYTAILLTISSVALAAPMESGSTIAMRQQSGGILSGLTSLLGNGGQQAPNNGTTGGILSGITNLLGNPGGQAPATSNQNAPKTGATGSIMSGITSLLGNLGSHLPGNGDQYPPNKGGSGGIMADLQVLPDHMKFVTNPPTAEVPIPAEQNSQMREGHRLAHVAINKGLGVGGADKSTASQD